jgi:uracil-DNA glycosylase
MAALLRRPASTLRVNSSLDAVLRAVRGCRVCADSLPLGPRPVLQAGSTARVLIVGQAPGLRVHRSGIPWDDPSGERLREWMGVAADVFYDASRIAIIPMGYCYPGRGRSGDLPPRPECAQLWLAPLLTRLPQVELTLLVGQHAQRHFLRKNRKATLAATVAAWTEYSPHYVPLPHPSPRNTPWLQRHGEFEQQLLPELRRRIAEILARRVL